VKHENLPEENRRSDVRPDVDDVTDAEVSWKER
jgi:hypothetical protein